MTNIRIYNEPSKFDAARNRYSLGLRCQWGIDNALFYVCRDSAEPKNVLGTAMWIPPTPVSEPQSWSLYLSYWKLWIGQVYMNAIRYGRGGLNVGRYWIWKSRQAEAQAEIWGADGNAMGYKGERGFYFCNIVTVLPEAQGKGIGRALMEEVLKDADEKGLPCYLESSKRQPNVPIYEKFGFKLVREMRCSDEKEEEGINLYCMVREPKAKS